MIFLLWNMVLVNIWDAAGFSAVSVATSSLRMSIFFKAVDCKVENVTLKELKNMEKS